MFELLYETIDQMVWMYWLYKRERNTKIADRYILYKIIQHTTLLNIQT